MKTDEDLGALVERLGLPHPPTSVRLGRHLGALPDAVKEHDEAVEKLEMILAGYLRGGQLAQKRSTTRVGGWWIFGGRKVDAISHYTELIAKLEIDIEGFRAGWSDSAGANYGESDSFSPSVRSSSCELTQDSSRWRAYVTRTTTFGTLSSTAPNSKPSSRAARSLKLLIQRSGTACRRGV